MTIILDKIASVTKNVPLDHRVEISKHIIPEEGAVLAVEVLEDKKTYNQLELVSGRLSTIQKGDLIAVALGKRRALKGFVGTIPKELKAGDIINVLNLGGVAGICTSENVKVVGHALKVKVLGAIVAVDNSQMPLNIRVGALFSPSETIELSAPLVVVSGTCMNVGKTSVACEIIKHASRKGLIISAAKLAGVAALRDTENMRDYGAHKIVSFIDAGLTSTVENGELSRRVTKGAISYLAKEKPDYIVIEFGDGVYGEYGVMDILKDPEIQKNIVAHVGCAHDPMGAVKLAEICQQIGAPLHLISGPVTDNSVGIDFIQRTLNLPGINALYSGDKLFSYLSRTCFKK